MLRVPPVLVVTLVPVLVVQAFIARLLVLSLLVRLVLVILPVPFAPVVQFVVVAVGGRLVAVVVRVLLSTSASLPSAFVLPSFLPSDLLSPTFSNFPQLSLTVLTFSYVLWLPRTFFL